VTVDDVLLRLLVVLAVVVVATVVGRWWTRREGHLREVGSTAPAIAPAELAELGFDLGTGTVALLLSAPTCSTCVPVRRLLDELALTRRDLEWTDVDVSRRTDLAERFGVLRLPTVLLFEPDGHLVARASGVPPRDELEAHLDRHARVATA
jgi:thiol-disulfide isomerase/thioredoxin